MKIKILALASLWVACGLSSCIDDESSMGGLPVPQLEIAGSTGEKLPVFNFDMGKQCVIEPQIIYNGGDEKSLVFEWSVGTYQEATGVEPAVKGPLKVVSTDRVLSHMFTEGGSHYAHLKVTDGKVGAVMEYQVNINRTFEKGYVLVSNDMNGNGNLVFVKEMTPEELESGKSQVIIEHAVEAMNPDYSSMKTLLGVSHKTITYPTVVKRLMVAAEDACYYLDPNRFTIATDLKYEEVLPGFKATLFTPWDFYPYVYDGSMKRFLHFEPEQMYLFENVKFDDVFLDDLFVNTEYSPYNGLSSLNYYVDYANSQIGEMGAWSGVFSTTGDFFKNEDIISVFKGPVVGYSPSIYVLVKSKKEPSQCALHKLESITSEKSEVNSFVITDNMAFPHQGTKMMFSERNSRYFYAMDNLVYVYLPNSLEFPNKTQYAIQYAAGTEVTYLDINPETDELYVATYEKAKKRGSFYIYDAKDVSLDNRDHVKPKAAHVDCADRISFVMYKPSM